MGLSGGVVDYDLPALVGFFEDEGEDSFYVAAVLFAAVELVFADADGEFFVEAVDFEIGEGEGTHGGFVGVVVLVLFDEAFVSAGDLVGDEEGVGGVFVGLGEAVDVAAVPGGLLGEQDLDDVELYAGGGVEVGGGVLRACRGVLRSGRGILRTGWRDGEDEEDCEQGGKGLTTEFAGHRAGPQC